MNRKLLVLFLFFCCTWHTIPAHAQKDNADIILKEALVETNQNKNYPKAISLALRGLKLAPDYTDIRVLLGRLYLLSDRTDEGIAELKKVIAVQPKNADALALLINAFYGQKDYESTLSYISAYRRHYPTDKSMIIKEIGIFYEAKNDTEGSRALDAALVMFPGDEALLLKKTEVYEQEGKVKEAYQTAKMLHEQNPENASTKLLYQRLFAASRANRIGVHYSHTFFDPSNWHPWNVYGLSYLRSEKKISFGARINYADRGNTDGYQFELEAYPTHGRSYSYINAAYSNAPVFPEYRASYSFYTPLSQAGDWEGELGIRYIHSLESFLGYTAALGKYFDRTWLNFRANATPSNQKLKVSYSFIARQYLTDRSDDYLSFSAGYGFSPEVRDISFDIRQRISLESLRFGLGYQRTLWQRNIFGLFGTWNRQEFAPDRKRNEMELAVSFQHKF